MFKFLKDKLKNAVSAFTKKVDEKAEEVIEETVEETTQKPVKTQSTVEKKTVTSQTKKEPSIVTISKKLDDEKNDLLIKKEHVSKVFKKTDTKTKPTQTVVKSNSKQEVQKVEGKREKTLLDSQKREETVEVEKTITSQEQSNNITDDTKTQSEPQKEKKGFFSRLTQKITKKHLTQEQFEELFFDLEMILLENNVAVEVIDKLKEDLEKELVQKAILRSEIQTIVQKTLYKSIDEIVSFEKVDIFSRITSKSPYIISFVGVNGSGKTTHLAKFVQLLQSKGISCVVGACDTFRAAAIQQLEEHTQKLGVKLIKHDYGADAAAVAFDAVAHAKAKGFQVVLLDTAGRLHSNTNLMDELRKIKRVVNPDFTFFVGESITGNDCVEQAKEFDNAVSIDGIILSKADIDEKGGASLSVAYVTKRPILYFGTGQSYDDLEEFDKKRVLDNLGLES